jgi:hypothetical protein
MLALSAVIKRSQSGVNLGSIWSQLTAVHHVLALVLQSSAVNPGSTRGQARVNLHRPTVIVVGVIERVVADALMRKLAPELEERSALFEVPRVQLEDAKYLRPVPVRYRSPRHRTSFYSKNEGSKCDRW